MRQNLYEKSSDVRRADAVYVRLQLNRSGHQSVGVYMIDLPGTLFGRSGRRVYLHWVKGDH